MKFKTLFLFCLLFSQLSYAQQILSKATNAGLWNNFYLYKGDKLKYEFTGSNAKNEVYFGGPTIGEKKFDDSFEKVDNINTKEWIITKDGPHTIGMVTMKSKGDLRLIRIPAEGKADAPLTFMQKFSFSYEIKENKPNTPFEKYYTRKINNKFSWDFETDYYLPADEVLSKKLSDFQINKAETILNEKIEFLKLGGVILNQLPFAFQKGDTIVFNISVVKPKQSESFVWVARPDQYIWFNPDQWSYNGATNNSQPTMTKFLTQNKISSNVPIEGSFVLKNDGFIGFYFQNLTEYEIKIFRFPGIGNTLNLKIPYEKIPVYRSAYGDYVLEPKIENK